MSFVIVLSLKQDYFLQGVIWCYRNTIPIMLLLKIEKKNNTFCQFIPDRSQFFVKYVDNGSAGKTLTWGRIFSWVIESKAHRRRYIYIYYQLRGPGHTDF